MTLQEAIDFKARHPLAILIIDGDTAFFSSDVELPTVELPMNVARKMLREVGYLQYVDAAIAQLGDDARDDYEYAPFVHSDNPLVRVVLNGLGRSDAQIYQLFADAKSKFLRI